MKLFSFSYFHVEGQLSVNYELMSGFILCNNIPCILYKSCFSLNLKICVHRQKCFSHWLFYSCPQPRDQTHPHSQPPPSQTNPNPKRIAALPATRKLAWLVSDIYSSNLLKQQNAPVSESIFGIYIVYISHFSPKIFYPSVASSADWWFVFRKYILCLKIWKPVR